MNYSVFIHYARQESQTQRRDREKWWTTGSFFPFRCSQYSRGNPKPADKVKFTINVASRCPSISSFSPIHVHAFLHMHACEELLSNATASLEHSSLNKYEQQIDKRGQSKAHLCPLIQEIQTLMHIYNVNAFLHRKWMYHATIT